MNRGGSRITRVFGITIRVDWNWLIILALVTWNLSRVFGQVRPDRSTVLTWALSLAAALLFFLSVLTHELAHSLVARSRGIPVEDITLFIFGGASDIEEQPDTPGGEFLMAVLGPVTSVVIGVILPFLAWVAGNPGAVLGDPEGTLAQLKPLTTLLVWLGSINVVLGVFNMIPGFPLDGGRVLRSIVWALTGSLETATRFASIVGLVIGWAMIAGGLLIILGVSIPVFGSGFVSGLWLSLIGWFLHSAAIRYLQRGPRPGRSRPGGPLEGRWEATLRRACLVSLCGDGARGATSGPPGRQGSGAGQAGSGARCSASLFRWVGFGSL